MYRFGLHRLGLRTMATGGSYEHILISTPKPGVRLIQLHRPKALNALSSALIREINTELRRTDEDESLHAVVITGSEKAFAAGADIKEMQTITYGQATTTRFIDHWGDVARRRKPIIAAVNGFALGGGCELAMMADIMYVGDKAVLGQPEIKLGVIPGGGGTQRLTKALGKARAMELILTGRNFSGEEAVKWGLAARQFPAATLVDESVKIAAEIASFSPLAVAAGKAAVNDSYDMPLASGLRAEQTHFYGLFGSHDQKEGMLAFVEKRKPTWKGE